MPSEPKRPSSSTFEGDFAPGEVLIGRYRVIALVGEGGMGQVYLADDLVLGQPVALKFLPEHIADREGGLERFRAEVRHAREVTHPNVARVHDIGEVAGRHFLTMEFVDGEDLASLIKRIGRMPREKAAEIGQQICAGLGEAHRRGVLHRDLKPANVMLDGEGCVRLTDFGLAVAAEAGGDSGQAGTPQYMAPEQLSGVDASVQSEVYSLGLVLYELYTGRRALRGRTLEQLRLEHERGGPDPPSSHLGDLDPSVDAVLTRCLARDPALRPASVAEVARALPGGDPLAAALAAGETPAPHLVAAARTEGALTSRGAAALIVAGAAFFVLLILGRSWMQEREGFSYGKPSAYLREHAREVAKALTGADEFAHEVHWYTYDRGIAAASDDDREGAFAHLLPLVHHSRFGPEDFVPRATVIDESDPAPVPGSMHLVLDAGGRLVSWEHWRDDRDPERGADPVEWGAVLALAGFSPDDLSSAEPRHTPDVFADEQAAWRSRASGSGDGGPDEASIEAAALDGHVVQFELVHDSKRLGALQDRSASAPLPVNLFMLGTLVLAAVFAWRNVRAGRADVRGAILLGTFEALVHEILAFGRALPDNAAGVVGILSAHLSYALQTGVRVILLYLAIEPFARRRWPRLLIGWNRLLQGSFRDDSVGRELLCGLLAAAVFVSASVCLSFGLEAAGLERFPVVDGSLHAYDGIEGPLQTLSLLLHAAGDGVIIGGTLVFGLVVLRSLIRSPWAAIGAWFLLMSPIVAQFQGIPTAVVLLATILIALVRAGFLAVAVMWFAFQAFASLPLTLDTGAWYFPSSIVVLVAFAALWLWGWRAAITGGTRAAVRG